MSPPSLPTLPTPGALALLVLLSPLAQAGPATRSQVPGNEAPPLAPAAAVQATGLRYAFGLHAEGTRLVGGGTDYKVELLPGAFQFTPALGQAVETTRSLTWSLRSIERENTVWIEADPTVRPALQASRAVWNRARGIEERLEFSPEGVELSYLFPERPAGEGDLVVRGQLETNLQLRAGHRADGALEFLEAGVGGLSIGQVFGVDANGATITGSTRLVDGLLELVLPAEFVDAAAYPLLLDPFIGSTKVVGSGYDENFPDVAYDATEDEFLVVWQRSFSSQDIDIRGRRLDGLGNPIGLLLLIETDNDQLGVGPSVGSAGSAGAFLVAWQQSILIFGSYDIRARAVGVGTGALGTPATLNVGNLSANSADVGDSSTDGRVLVAWSEFGGGIRARVPEVLSNLTLYFGLFGGPGVITVATTTGDVQPAVSKSGSASSVWAVVWQRNGQTPSDDSQIAARMIRSDSALVSSTVYTGLASRDEATPDVDGDGSRFMVAYARDESSSSNLGDIIAQPLLFDGTTASFGAPAVVHDSPNDNDFLPAIAYTGNAYVVAWQDDSIDPPYEVRAAVIDALDGEPCGTHFGVPSVGAGQETQPRIASKYKSPGDPNSQVVITLLKGTIDDADQSVQAAVYETRTGIAVDLGGGCPAEAEYIATCIASNTTSKHELHSAPPFTSVFLLGSVPSTPFPCDGCTLFPNPFTGFLLNGFTDSDGRDRLEIFVPPGLDGSVLHFQWALATPSPGCSVFSVDLSNALEVTIQ